MSQRQAIQLVFLYLCGAAATIVGFVFLLQGKFVHGLLSMVLGGVWSICADLESMRYDK